MQPSKRGKSSKLKPGEKILILLTQKEARRIFDILWKEARTKDEEEDEWEWDNWKYDGEDPKEVAKLLEIERRQYRKLYNNLQRQLRFKLTVTKDTIGNFTRQGEEITLD